MKKMNNNIRFIGKHVTKNNKEYFAFSGTGFEFIILPKEDNFSFTLSLISEVREYEFQYLGVFIDGVFYSKEKLVSGQNNIRIDLKKTEEKILVRVIKLNEVYLSSVYLKEVVLNNAEFGNKPLPKKNLIGFYGDSLTCGYGTSGFRVPDFTMESEEFHKCYAYLASEKLDMDYSVIARSGISVGIKIYCDLLFNEIYDTVDMYEKCSFDRTIDYAVINLGTNDSNGYFDPIVGKNKSGLLEKFVEEYIKLVERIIKDNPNVKVLMCYNMAKKDKLLNSKIKFVNDFIKAHYTNKCELLEFIPNADGVNNHPYLTAHESSAKLLVAAIKSL